MMDRKRNRARAWALQALYAWEMRDAPPREMLGILQDLGEHMGFAAHNRFFADVLVQLTAENLPQIDGIIEQQLSNWRLDRLAAVDRNLLRLGVAELLFLDDVPPRDTIREMVYLAGLYGTPESPRFINGVLDAVLHSVATQRALERRGGKG